MEDFSERARKAAKREKARRQREQGWKAPGGRPPKVREAERCKLCPFASKALCSKSGVGCDDVGEA